MHRYLVRSTMLAVLLAVAVVGILPAAGRLWYALWPRQVITDAVADLTAPRVALIGSVLGVGLGIVAIALGYLVAAYRARRLSAHLVALAEQADLLGQGSSKVHILDSGIAEVDRVSSVLVRNAAAMTRSLAAERDFAADASHQLRTPLTALLMRLEEINLTDDPAVVAEESTIAIAQVERLTTVVDELLARTRRRDVALPAVSLDSVIAGLQREWQVAFARARRSVHVSGERGLQVAGTPVALSQILSTLLENSLAHGAGTVEVSARHSGPSVVVEVGDAGPGIAAQIAPRIFERSVSSTGGGLGLTLARDLAESIGGRLELTSAQPAVFALFLSDAADEPAAAVPRAIVGAPGGEPTTSGKT